jgi:RNA-binding protein
MKLGEVQSKHLRRRGHLLRPIVMIGGAGPTAAVMAELDAALDHHELLKIRVRVADRTDRDAIFQQIVEATDATLVQRIGNVALLYRPAPAQEAETAKPATGKAARHERARPAKGRRVKRTRPR